jgi:hypothetical protein
MIIHQMLYGYKNGHSLFSTSVDLPSEDKSLLLELSDWSGVNEQRVSSYLTGFPLIQSGYYALIRTWYADDMSRPGCAWSHVLLIHIKSFSELVNVQQLNNLFIKPEINSDFAFYSKSLVIENTDEVSSNLSNLIKPVISEFSQNYIQELIYQLFTSPNNIYVEPSTTTEAIEKLFLTLWWSQPINDRFLFSFCTGSNKPRRLFNNELNLQCVFNDSYKQYWIRSINGNNEINNDWVNTLYKNLVSDNQSFIKYLNNLTDDITSNKNKIVGLSEIFNLIDGEIIYKDSELFVDKILNLLSSYFPDKTEARKIKKALLSEDVLKSLDIESYFLKQIFKSEGFSAFDIDELKIPYRILNIYETNSSIFFELVNNILKEDIYDWGISILKESAKNITKNDIDILINDYWSIFTVYIIFRPDILKLNQSWTINEAKCLETINLLISNRNVIDSEVDWEFLYFTILQKGLNLFPTINVLFSMIKPNHISFLLDWYNKNDKYELKSSWHLELSKNPSSILTWIQDQNNINLHTKQLIVKVINPNSRDTKKAGLRLWINFSESIKTLPLKDSIYIHAFLTSLAFNFNDKEAILLLKNSFSIIYNEIANDKLDYKLMSMVLIHTKPLMFWQDWDKCKKLRNALADKFNEARWEKKYIQLIIDDFALAKEIEFLCWKRK